MDPNEWTLTLDLPNWFGVANSNGAELDAFMILLLLICLMIVIFYITSLIRNEN
jgi:hypothetical protein